MAKNSNAAYDFDLFEPQEKTNKSVKKTSATPNLRVVKQAHNKAQSQAFTLKAVGCVLVFFVGVIAILLSQSAVNEVTKQVGELSAELTLLQADYRMLETELESSVSIQNIESTVTRELGMSKLRDDQVSYVNLTPDEVEQPVFGEPTTILGKIKAAFKRVLAYANQKNNTIE